MMTPQHFAELAEAGYNRIPVTRDVLADLDTPLSTYLKLADMPILEGLCENMWVLMGPFLRLFHDRMPVRKLSSENHKHFDLLVALEAHDSVASEAAMQEDIRWGEELLDTLEEELRGGASLDAAAAGVASGVKQKRS